MSREREEETGSSDRRWELWFCAGWWVLATGVCGVLARYVNDLAAGGAFLMFLVVLVGVLFSDVVREQ